MQSADLFFGGGRELGHDQLGCASLYQMVERNSALLSPGVVPKKHRVNRCLDFACMGQQLRCRSSRGRLEVDDLSFGRIKSITPTSRMSPSRSLSRPTSTSSRNFVVLNGCFTQIMLQSIPRGGLRNFFFSAPARLARPLAIRATPSEIPLSRFPPWCPSFASDLGSNAQARCE